MRAGPGSARALAAALLCAAGLAGAPVRGAEVLKLKLDLGVYIDGAGQGMREPEGLDCAPGTLAVADTGNGRILLYDVRQDTVRPRGAVVVPQLPRPLRVALLADGEILVLDARSRRIGRLTATGEFRGWLEPAGESITPRSLAVAKERVYVLDVAGRRVLVLDRAGVVERAIAFAAETGFLSDIAVDGRGDVYAVDSVGRRVHVARAGEAALAPLTPPLVEDLDFPTALAADGEGRLFVVDEFGGGVVVVGRDGSFHGRQLGLGWKEGLVRYPTDVCLDGQGHLFLVERGNSRVQMFSLD